MIRLCILMLAALGLASAALAHEVRPAVGDLYTQDGRLVLELRIVAEPMLAGVDLQGVTDTNDTDGSDAVDALRALPAEELAQRLAPALPGLVARLDVRVDGQALELAPVQVRTDPVGVPDLPRESQVVLSGPLPRRAATVELTWPAAYGTLILRQQGVAEPYTGFLAGQSTGPIPLFGARLSLSETLRAFAPLGFAQVLPLGPQHLLCVLALAFLAAGTMPLVAQMAVFVLGYGVTLVAAALGLVALPGGLVAALLAGSLVYLGIENLLAERLQPWRLAAVLVFGLLHGLALAEVLVQLGLPQGRAPVALAAFHAGASLALAAALAFVLLLVWYARRVIDGGAGRRGAQVFYALLALGFAALALLPGDTALVRALAGQVWAFAVPLAALALACLLAVTRMETWQPYQRLVARPASLAIACAGLWWLVAQQLL